MAKKDSRKPDLRARLQGLLQRYRRTIARIEKNPPEGGGLEILRAKHHKGLNVLLRGLDKLVEETAKGSQFVTDRVELYHLCLDADKEQTVDQLKALVKVVTMGLTKDEIRAFERKCKGSSGKR